MKPKVISQMKINMYVLDIWNDAIDIIAVQIFPRLIAYSNAVAL